MTKFEEFRGRWIPVTEDRPGPEEEGHYLVTVENEGYEGQDVAIAVYELDGMWSYDFFIVGDIVTAWMPLPCAWRNRDRRGKWRRRKEEQ